MLPPCESLRPPADDGPEAVLDRLPEPLPDAAPGDGPSPPEALARAREAMTLIHDPAGARWDLALDQLLRVWRMYPSKKLAGWVARCAIELKRYNLAIDAYERFLESHTKESDFTRELEAKIKVLTRSAVTVHLTHLTPNQWLEDTITVPGEAPIVLNFTPTSGAAVVRVPPGHHVFRDPERKPWEVDLAPGADVRHELLPVERPCR